MSYESAANDQCLLTLCLWREARGEGHSGMLAVGCVVRNRVKRDRSTYYSELSKPWQFSSLTAPEDPQLSVWADPLDPQWIDAGLIAASIIADAPNDITDGATLYYAETIPFPPSWNRSKCHVTAQIGKHIFLTERA